MRLSYDLTNIQNDCRHLRNARNDTKYCISWNFLASTPPPQSSFYALTFTMELHTSESKTNLTPITVPKKILQIVFGKFLSLDSTSRVSIIERSSN